jgi:hypothetical protein
MAANNEFVKQWRNQYSTKPADDDAAPFFQPAGEM